MTRINAVVEGDTEETFVRRVLAPYLAETNAFITPRRVLTSRQGARIYRGGMVGFTKARWDIMQWLAQDKTAFVTTMFDLFRLPDDFPGHNEVCHVTDSNGKVRLLEEELARSIDNPRFIPYIQKHEFEALLFSDVAITDQVLSITGSHSKLEQLTAIRSAFSSPEDINNNPTTAPSKRLIKLYPGYDKEAFGTLISERIGIAKIRKECLHFNQWLTRLESL